MKKHIFISSLGTGMGMILFEGRLIDEKNIASGHKLEVHLPADSDITEEILIEAFTAKEMGRIAALEGSHLEKVSEEWLGKEIIIEIPDPEEKG